MPVNIQTYLEKMSYGPLSDLAIAGKGSGLVPEKDVPKMMLAANAALIVLYTRFQLKRKQLHLRQIDGRTEYPLAPEFSLTSDSDETERFIIDSLESPFQGDILTVLGVKKNQCPVPLNDSNDPCSWHLNSFDVLSSPDSREGDFYLVEYLARHMELPLVPSETQMANKIQLPYQLEEAFLAYAGHKVYLGMNMEHSAAKASMLLSVFEAECVRLENSNTLNTYSSNSNLKPVLGGWIR